MSAAFLPPRNAPPQQLIDYEMGGAGISDPSRGLMVKAWRMRWIEGDFIIDAQGTPAQTVYSRAGVTEFSFTFDQNMKVFLTFVDATGAYYYWYDATIPGYTLVALASGIITPKCSLDDKRLNQVSISDIILAYIRSGNLYYRQQRDRFGTERLLKAGVGGYLRRIGMNEILRFQFDIGQTPV
jgi:hypothetical protein